MNDDDDDESDHAAVTADDIRTMSEEIQRGLHVGKSTVATTAAHRRIWDDLTDQHHRHR